MTVVSPMIEPDRDAIKLHLDTLFGRAQSDYPGGLVELRWGIDGALNQHAYFNLQDSGLTEAAAFAANRNREGTNVYVGVNPRKPNTSTRDAAKDVDVEVAFYYFADIDKGESLVGLVERYSALPPTMTLTTGTVPNKRPHLYWRLEEPVMNMEEWTHQQRAIAHHLKGDGVINPSRIMRLGGTVNFPTQQKLGRGYRVELTAVRTEFGNERMDVSPQSMATVYPAVSGSSQDFNHEGGSTLKGMMRTQFHDLVDACLSGNEWHNNMVRLVAHLAAIGRGDAEILALADHITLSGYAVDQTVREMRQALTGARRKWDIPQPEETIIEEEEATREAADSVFLTLNMDELEALPPPTWLIDELIADHGLSIVYGDPGAGKSFVVLDMALRLAFGMDWHGRTAIQAGVLYIAGEGARGIGKRVMGWRKEHALEGVDAPFLLLPVAVQMLDKVERAKLLRTIDAVIVRAGFPIGCVVIDTVSRAIAGQDENGQESMSMFVEGCAQIQNHTHGAVIGVHHSGKDKDRGMRGSTVLLGGCDASLKVKKNGETVTLEVEKQKDAEEAEPIYLTMKKLEWGAGLGKEQSTLVPVMGIKPRVEEKTLSFEDISVIFDEIARAWMLERPYTNTAVSKNKGRYLPRWIVEKFEVSYEAAEGYVTDWLYREYLALKTYSRGTRAQALCVIKRLERDQ